MINGNAVVLQVGEESTYGTAAAGTEQIKISSESMKPSYNKVSEGLATGGRGAGKVQTMGIKVEGGYSTLLRPDMGKLLKWTLGASSTPVTVDGVTTHTFTAIGTGLNDSLASFTTIIDRKAGVFAYPGCKVNSLSLSASSGDYVKADVTIVGKDEETGTLATGITPSARKAFKFADGKVKINGTAIADVRSFNLDYNNNLDSDTQTTDTGLYYKEPECGTREISASCELLYSASAETIRTNLYKTDDTFSVELEFVSDEDIVSGTKYSMKVKLNCCQCSDAGANMGGLDTLTESLSFNVVDNLSDELIEIKLINGTSTQY